MADEMKYCRKCGTPAAKDARFCSNCGCAFSEEPKKILPKAGYCQSCGRENSADARFCRYCGNPMDTAAASTTAGEIDFGEMEMFDGPGAAAGKESKILWPGVLLFAVLWFVLAQFRDSDAGIIRVLSWITFSEGGFDRPVPGMIGGALGKGIVAAALVSLCSGGLKNVFRGVRVLFAGSGRRRDIPMILAGIVTGAAAYYVFAGMQASAGTAMAGIAGALLSLETLGSGRLFELAQSLTSRRVNGGRKAMGDRCDGLFTGLTLGFILAAAVSAAGIPGRLL